MAVTTLISLGYPQSMAQNVIYAVPARACVVLVDDIIEISNTTTFATFGTVASNTPTTISAAFARCTNSTCTITAKAH